MIAEGLGMRTPLDTRLSFGFLLLAAVVVMLLASGLLGATAATTSGFSSVTTGATSTIQSHGAFTVNVTEDMTISETPTLTQWLVWDPFSTLVFQLCLTIAVPVFFGLLIGLAGPMKRPIRFSLIVAALTAAIIVIGILIIVGPASQVLIPSIRSMASGSWEIAVPLSAVLVMCLVALILIVRRTPGRTDQTEKREESFQVVVKGENNIVLVGKLEVSSGPSIQSPPSVKISNLTADPPMFQKGLLRMGGQVNDEYGSPVPGALIQIHAYAESYWTPTGSPFVSGSDGRFSVELAPSPPTAFVPVVTEYADVTLIGDDLRISRSQLPSTKRLSTGMDLFFKNCGNVETSLFPITWGIEHVPDLSITLELPSQRIQNIRPNIVLPLKPNVNFESQKSIVSTLEAHGGTVEISVTYKFSVPLGNTNTKKSMVRVLLTE